MEVIVLVIFKGVGEVVQRWWCNQSCVVEVVQIVVLSAGAEVVQR